MTSIPILVPLQRGLSRRIHLTRTRSCNPFILWDHMDAILCEAITPLVDGLLGTNSQTEFGGGRD